MNNTNLIVVGTYREKMEAEIARSALEAAQIESMVQGDNVHGGPGFWIKDYELLVRAEDVERASEILGRSKPTPRVGVEAD